PRRCLPASGGKKMRRLTEEERAMMAEQMDGMAPFRNITGFFGLLMMGKAIPDAAFMYLRKLAGIRGAENLDFNMFGFDLLLAIVGGGLRGN
ncbi:unnamed protein product, partial [Prorocentrum cordatum]